ncbi:hypothetical protein PRIPAC_79481 [Pristionchus pacificus]|uniref:Uncharacterized protein n=1 Tax=Pristionchus pacificus TaxID=54126 RepID=A0A2A6BI27_PRIPA|nr:hypothetical protein PRIPAC_79481 [Pristionchus pacificus]|eukprot:PDM65527.1 hypothetical protein PRIPAC_52469 [Pristionchus pacificus]
MADAVSLDARRVLGRTRVLKARLKTNKEKAEALADLRLRSENLIEERRRIESAEKVRAAKNLHLGGEQVAAFERPPTVGGMLASCAHDNAKDFIAAVGDVRSALMQIFTRTHENEKLALKEAVTLEEMHRDRIKDAATALRLLHDSADRMQLRVEKRAIEEKNDTTETERLRLLLDARRAELALYEAKRAILTKELDMMGSQKGHDLPPVPAVGSTTQQPQQDTPDLHELIIETMQRALDELEKNR